MRARGAKEGVEVRVVNALGREGLALWCVWKGSWEICEVVRRVGGDGRGGEVMDMDRGGGVGVNGVVGVNEVVGVNGVVGEGWAEMRSIDGRTYTTCPAAHTDTKTPT